ncbi:acetate/propionate family kinase [Desulfamplus magnetovallimortis]|nr:acetate kinase [Desulfamplus magnetovallimortis]
MKILIINAGSSSLKYQLIEIQESESGLTKTSPNNMSQSHRVMAAGVVERIGDTEGSLIHKKFVVEKKPSDSIGDSIGQANITDIDIYNSENRNQDELSAKDFHDHIKKDQKSINCQNNTFEKFTIKKTIKDHRAAMHLAASMLSAHDSGVICSTDEIDAIGHRVVQGGEQLNASIRIDDGVKKAIKENNPLAPLHNPPNLTGIEVAEELFPGIPNVAVFDTEFHKTIPPQAYMYALPYDFYLKYRVRRYGFHGTSHKYVTATAENLIKNNRGRGEKCNKTTSHESKANNSDLCSSEKRELNLITVHLGNGCSICAVKQGRCVDTSMGMTPLAGVMMGTRTGDMDPAIQRYLIENTNFTPEALDSIFNKESGLKGICGMNDMRDIHAAIGKGDKLAELALEMFTYQIKKYIGAYTAVLGSVDGIVFTAGIGENDAAARAKICSNLSGLGIEIDADKNKELSSEPRAIHSVNSKVDVWVIPTNEELQIAKEVLHVMESEQHENVI